MKIRDEKAAIQMIKNIATETKITSLLNFVQSLRKQEKIILCSALLAQQLRETEPKQFPESYRPEE